MKARGKKVLSLIMAVLMSVSLFTMDFASVKAEGLDGEVVENVEQTEEMPVLGEEETESEEDLVVPVNMSGENEDITSECSEGEAESEEQIEATEISEELIEDIEVEEEEFFTYEILLNAPKSIKSGSYKASLNPYETNKDDKGNPKYLSGSYKKSGASVMDYPRYGECLVLDTEGIDLSNTIKWYRNGVPVDNKEIYTSAKINEYVLTKDDIGAVISCSFIFDGIHSVLATDTVQKGIVSLEYSDWAVTVNTDSADAMIVRDCNSAYEYALVEDGFLPSFSTNDLAYLKGNKGVKDGDWTISGLRVGDKYQLYVRFLGNDLYESFTEKCFDGTIGSGKYTSCSHSTKSAWRFNGKYHYHVCYTCDAILDMKEHYDYNGDHICDECGIPFVADRLMVIYDKQDSGRNYRYSGSPIKPSVKIYDGTKCLVEGKDYELSYVNNINAHTVTGDNDPNAPTIKIKGKGSYNGEILQYGKPCTFTIDPKPVFDVDISDKDKFYETYSILNKEHKPTISTTIAGKKVTFKKGTDYDLVYTVNGTTLDSISKRGKYKVNINFKGNYSGTVSYNIEVDDKQDLSKLKLNVTNPVYNTVGVYPKLTLNGKDFSYSVNTSANGVYVSSCTENTKAGTVTMVLTAGENNEDYYGSKTVTYKIMPFNIADAFQTVIDYTPHACWSPKTDNNKLSNVQLKCTIYDSDNRREYIDDLEEGVDFKIVSYKNLNTANPTVEIKMQGSYTGTYKYTYSLNKPYINDATANIAYVTSEAEAKKAKPVLVYDGVTLKEGTDYTLSEPRHSAYGESYFYTVTGEGMFYGGWTLFTYIIPSDKKLISKQKVTIADMYYNSGEPVKPQNFTIGGKEYLLDSKWVKFENNTGLIDKKTVATAYIEIPQNANFDFAGTVTVKFNILPNDLKNAVITPISEQSYTSVEICPTLYVSLNEKVIYTSDGFEIEYSNNIKVGTAKIKIVSNGTGKYCGSKEVTFKIVPQVVDNTTLGSTVILQEKYGNGGINWNSYAHEWNKNGVKPEPVIFRNYYVNGTKYNVDLVSGKDYTVSYKNNNKVGTAQITVAFKGNYKGSITKDFTIGAKNIDNIHIDDISAVYKTDEKKNVPAPKVVVDGVTLVKDKDYYITNISGMTVPGSYNPGSNELAVRGMGNYDGVSAQFNYILKFNLADAKLVQGTTTSYMYTGERIQPDFDIQIGNRKVAWTNYKTEYTNTINVGTAKVKITPVSEYVTGSKEFTYKITPMTADRIKDNGEISTTYSPNGNNVLSNIDFFYLDSNGHKEYIDEGKDYTITYSNNKSAGTGKAVVKFKGNFTGTKEYNYAIEVASDFGNNVMISKGGAAVFNGSQGNETLIKVNPQLQYKGKALTYGKDYFITDTPAEVGWDGSKSFSTVFTGPAVRTFYIQGMGNYSGVRAFDFYVVPKGSKLMDSVNASKIPDQYYCKNAIEPDVTVNGQNVDIEYYNCKYRDNRGTYGTTSTGYVEVGYNGKNANLTNIYYGYKTIPYNIVTRDLKNAKLKKNIPNQAYTGNEKEPSFEVVFDGETVPSGQYTVEYSNNVNVGTAKVKITANYIGLYTGSKEFTFKIEQYGVVNDDSKITVNGGHEIVVAWKGNNTRKPEPEVKFNNQVLVKGTDYTLAYKNNTVAADRGSANAPTLIINFKGKYKGSYSVKYTIVPETLYKQEITIADKQYDSTKTDSWKQTSITVKTKAGGTTLKAGKDYEVVGYYASYTDEYNKTSMSRVAASRIQEGMDVYVLIKGIGNYKFETVAKYHTAPYKITDLKAYITAKTYTGGRIKLEDSDILFRDKKGNEVDCQYAIDDSSYINNINPGTASVTVKGTGAYLGQMKINFTINKKNVVK